MFVKLAGKIASKFMKLTVPTLDENTLTEDAESDRETYSSTEEDTECSTDQDTKVDHVFTCAVDLLNLSLLWYGIQDATRKGDGNRILKYWKFCCQYSEKRSTIIMQMRELTF